MGEGGKRHGAKVVMADGHYECEGDAIDVAVSMLDIEARKDLPDSARAAAQFCRLIGPTLVEALDVIVKRHGEARVMASLGQWLAELGIGTIVMQAEATGLPADALTHVVAINVLAFQNAAFNTLADFERSRGRGPTKVSFRERAE